MSIKKLGLISAFIGFAANAISALNAPFARAVPDEVERLREKLISKASTSNAVLMLPRSMQRHGRFLWLAAHGSHVSHASHASHASHTSGTSSQSYTSPYSVPYTYSPWINASPSNPIEALVVKDANLRTGPSTTYEKIAVFNPGQKVSVIELSGSWLKVYTKLDGVTIVGWISEENIKRN